MSNLSESSRSSVAIAALAARTLAAPLLATILMIASAVELAAPARAAEAGEPIVGVAAPLSGPHADIGTAIRQAAEAALAETSRAAANVAARLRVEDDRCEAAAAEAVATRMAEAKVAVVIGHPCGSASAAAAKVYARANILFLSLSRHPAALPFTSGLKPLRLAGRDDRQGRALAAALLRTDRDNGGSTMGDNGGSTMGDNGDGTVGDIAVVHDRTQYAQAIATDFMRALTASGRRPKLSETIVAGEKDYGALAARLTAQRIGTLVFAGFPAETAVIARDLRARHPAVRILASDTMAASEFLRLAGSAADGVHVALPYMPVSAIDAPPSAKAPPLSPAQVSARAARLALVTWRAAVAATGGMVPASVRMHLTRRAGAPTGHADVVFDEAGDAILPGHALYAWRGGRLLSAGP